MGDVDFLFLEPRDGKRGEDSKRKTEAEDFSHNLLSEKRKKIWKFTRACAIV